MTTSRSLELRHTQGFVRLFISSQFCHKIAPVPLTPKTSLAGKTALITGATTGIGLHAARHLLSLKLGRLIMAVRSPEKGASVAQQLRREFPGAVVDVYPLEMGSYESVTGLAGRLAAEFAPGSNNKRLDIAILNAGIVMPDFVRNKSTGHCEVIQVNYLSTVLLAILLLPVVSSPPGGKTSPGRLSIVGSGTALAAKIPNRDVRPFLASFDSPEKLKWDATERYFSSKALMHLFLVKLLDYLGDDKYGSDRVVVNIVDPGYTKGSGLHREAEGLLSAFLTASKELTGRTLDHAAWSYVDAVVRKGPESHGCFVMDGEIRPFAPIVHEPKGRELMDALWNETMAELEFAGVRDILK